MPHPRIHERIDRLIFGRAYPHVHKWMDSQYKKGEWHHSHWVKHHHMQAINKRFPAHQRNLDREAARLHVLVDWLFYFKIVFVPQTGSDVIMKLMEQGVVIL